jgi:hypothetical protein
MIEKVCSFCSKKIVLGNNPSGLVFDDKYFFCEDCCENHSEEEFQNFTQTVMQSSQKGMPIALWIIHEQNKDKTMMTSK